MSSDRGEPPGFTSQENVSVDPDRLFSALASRRSRFALTCLHEHDNPLSLADLADEVAVKEHDRALVDVPAEAVARVYLGLYHNDVPKLENLGFVEYEQERDLVALSESATDVTSLLDDLDLL